MYENAAEILTSEHNDATKIGLLVELCKRLQDYIDKGQLISKGENNLFLLVVYIATGKQPDALSSFEHAFYVDQMRWLNRRVESYYMKPEELMAWIKSLPERMKYNIHEEKLTQQQDLCKEAKKSLEVAIYKIREAADNGFFEGDKKEHYRDKATELEKVVKKIEEASL